MCWRLRAAARPALPSCAPRWRGSSPSARRHDGSAGLDHAVNLEVRAGGDGLEPRRIRIGGARIGEQNKDIIEMPRPFAEVVRAGLVGGGKENRDRGRRAVARIHVTAELL